MIAAAGRGAKPRTTALRHRLLATLAALPLLAACSLGPDYHRPEMALPAAFRATAATGAAAWPAEEWWRGFRSGVLDDLVGRARSGNFDLAAAAARIVQADAALRIAGAPLLPAVGATAQDQWSRSVVRSTSGSLLGPSATRYFETRLYSLSATASYELDFWGRLRANRDVALGNALFSRFDQETVALTVISSVATTWFQALAAEDRLVVAHRNLNDAQQILDAIRARLAVGTASELDVSQQAALVAGLRTQIPALQSQRDQFINGLGILLGEMPEVVSPPPGTLNELSLPEVAPGLPSELLARRPDVASAEAQLLAANASIRAARADFFPQITLTGTGGWQNFTVGGLFGPGALFASAAASAAQTIFDNGQKQATLEQAKGRNDELLADYRKAVVQAFTDVENALTAYRYATEQEALERQAVATAQRAADIARAQVLAGTSDIVQALQAQTTLYTDLDLLAQVRLSRFLALVSLYQALGGGWTSDAVVAPETPLLQGVL